MVGLAGEPDLRDAGPAADDVLRGGTGCEPVRALVLAVSVGHVVDVRRVCGLDLDPVADAERSSWD